MLAAMWNARSTGLNLLVQHHSLDHSGMREQSVLAQKSWAICKQNRQRPAEDRVVRRAVESRNLVSFVVSAAVRGLRIIPLSFFAAGRAAPLLPSPESRVE